MVDDQKSLGERGRALEEEFFRKEDQRLTAKLRELKAKEASREELSRISGIRNTAILDRLVELGIHAETLVALSIVPLAEVAWADGAIDAKEEQSSTAPRNPGSPRARPATTFSRAGPSRGSSPRGSTRSRASTRT